MTLLEPLALVGLLCLPLLVVFYLFRPEPRQEKSSTFFLWRKAVPDSAGGKFARRLQNNPLMWLQLLALLLLVLFLARPSTPWTSTIPTGNRVILMVDTSASMQAGNAFEEARSVALEAVDKLSQFRLGESPRKVMLIGVGAEAKVLVPFTTDSSVLRETLRDLQVSDHTDNLESLAPFVQSMVKAHEAKVWLIGDRLPEQLQVAGLQFTSVAQEETHNLGIQSFSVRGPDPARGQNKPFLFARVVNFSNSAQQCVLRLDKLDAREPSVVLATIWERRLSLATGQGETLSNSVPASRFEIDQASVFRLSLLPVPGDQSDSFPTDNEAFTVVAPFRKQKVIVATTPEVKASYLLRAIAASSPVKVVKVEDLVKQNSPNTVDLLLRDPSFKIPKKLKVHSQFLIAPDPNQEKVNQIVESLELSEKTSPLVSDSGVEWNRLKVQLTNHSTPEPGETVLLKTRRGPALTFSGLEQGIPTLNWRFPLGYSSLPLSTALPVVVGRFIDNYSKNSGIAIQGSVSAGQGQLRPTGHQWGGELEILPSAGRALTEPEGFHVSRESQNLPPLNRTGIYRLNNKDNQSSQPLACNLFSGAESALPRSLEDANFERGPTVGQEGKSPDPSQVQFSEIGFPLLLIVLLALLVETVWFLRRGRP